MATIVTVIASVRGAVHRPNAGPLTDALLEAWANEEYPTLRRRIADDVPDLFTRLTADIAVVDGVSSVDLSAAPVSLTDFGKLLTVELKSGTTYLPLRRASPLAASCATGLAGTYRVKYATKAALLVLGSSTVVDLPEGLERTLIQTLCARVREKFNESPKGHEDRAAAAYREVRDSLLRSPQTPETIANARASYGPAFRFRGPATVELVGW